MIVSFCVMKDKDHQGKSSRLQKVFDHVYLLQFDNQYELNMHFLRLQEFYESVNQQFRGKQFKILDYMQWYSVERAGCKGYFSYPDDWAGFNIPSHVFEDLYVKSTPQDMNDYDIHMIEVYETLKHIEDTCQFYVIGSLYLNQVFEHEIAHALFYIKPDYRREQLSNVSNLPEGVAAELRKTLMTEGYIEDVVDDEIQAYLSTGIGGSIYAKLIDLGYENSRRMKKLRKPFIDTFKCHDLSKDFRDKSLKGEAKLPRRKKCKG